MAHEQHQPEPEVDVCLCFCARDVGTRVYVYDGVCQSLEIGVGVVECLYYAMHNIENVPHFFNDRSAVPSSLQFSTTKVHLLEKHNNNTKHMNRSPRWSS